MPGKQSEAIAELETGSDLSPIRGGASWWISYGGRDSDSLVHWLVRSCSDLNKPEIRIPTRARYVAFE